MKTVKAKKKVIVLTGCSILKSEFERIAQIIRASVKPGDLLTHTRCLGAIEEHVFQGFIGKFIMGKATPTTKKFGGIDTDDIYPGNVTHINRNFWETIEYLSKESEIHISKSGDSVK